VPEREEWIAAKTGDELWATLERILSEKLGRPVSLRPNPNA
jgi:frataxin-like iron-binding protein CyaY